MIQPPTTAEGLEILTEYLADVTKAYRDDDEADGAGNLKLVLKIFIVVLKQRSNLVPAKFEWLQSIKNGRRVATSMLGTLLEEYRDAFSDWNPSETVKNAQQQCATILTWAIVEFDKEIYVQESAWPELKFAFDRERTDWHRMKTEAEESLRCD